MTARLYHYRVCTGTVQHRLRGIRDPRTGTLYHLVQSRRGRTTGLFGKLYRHNVPHGTGAQVVLFEPHYCTKSWYSSALAASHPRKFDIPSIKTTAFSTLEHGSKALFLLNFFIAIFRKFNQLTNCSCYVL